MPSGVAPSPRINDELARTSAAALDLVAELARQKGLRYRGIEDDFLVFERIDQIVIDREQALTIAASIYRLLNSSEDGQIRKLVDLSEGIRVA